MARSPTPPLAGSDDEAISWQSNEMREKTASPRPAGRRSGFAITSSPARGSSAEPDIAPNIRLDTMPNQALLVREMRVKSWRPWMRSCCRATLAFGAPSNCWRRDPRAGRQERSPPEARGRKNPS